MAYTATCCCIGYCFLTPVPWTRYMISSEPALIRYLTHPCRVFSNPNSVHMRNQCEILGFFRFHFYVRCQNKKALSYTGYASKVSFVQNRVRNSIFLLMPKHGSCTPRWAFNLLIIKSRRLLVLQVAVLIDTSASMASRLFLVKDKLYRLMQVGTLVKCALARRNLFFMAPLSLFSSLFMVDNY